MLSFINLSVQDHRKTVVENLQAVFHEGYVYGLYAPNAALLRPLLECIGGRHTAYKGNIVHNDGPLAGQAAWIDASSLVAEARKRSRVDEPAGAIAEAGSFETVPYPAYDNYPTDCPLPGIATRYPEKILLLHDLRVALPALPAIPPGKIVIISSHEYAALRNSCDFIYMFDKKRFPIVVAKADFHLFDDYFENVFRR